MRAWFPDRPFATDGTVGEDFAPAKTPQFEPGSTITLSGNRSAVYARADVDLPVGPCKVNKVPRPAPPPGTVVDHASGTDGWSPAVAVAGAGYKVMAPIKAGEYNWFEGGTPV